MKEKDYQKWKVNKLISKRNSKSMKKKCKDKRLNNKMKF